MSHFNFQRTDTSNGQKFFKVHSRKVDDVRIIFNGDGTVSWKDHIEHAQLFGGTVPKYNVIPQTYNQSKEDCDAEASHITEQFFKFGWQELPSH